MTPVSTGTYAPHPQAGASVGIISILLHMRLLLGPRRRRGGEGGRGGRGGRRRCEEEAADLISFSLSFIMASYCSNVGTTCGLHESSDRTRRNLDSLSRNTVKCRQSERLSHCSEAAQWCVKVHAGMKSCRSDAVTPKLLFVWINPVFFNSHVNAGTAAPQRSLLGATWGWALRRKSQDNHVSRKNVSSNINTQAGGIIHPFMICREHK